MVRRSRNTIQQRHGKFAESSLTSTKLSPRQSRAPTSLIHVASADSGSAELVCRSGNKISRCTRDKIEVAVLLKIIALPCCNDRLHSGFNLVRPLRVVTFHLRGRAYLTKSIAHRDMNKDGITEYEWDKAYLDYAHSLIILFPIQIVPVIELPLASGNLLSSWKISCL